MQVGKNHSLRTACPCGRPASPFVTILEGGELAPHVSISLGQAQGTAVRSEWLPTIPVYNAVVAISTYASTSLQFVVVLHVFRVLPLCLLAIPESHQPYPIRSGDG